MATVTQILNRVARRCSITPPSSWIAATNTEHIELRDDFLFETIENVRDRMDLPSPIGKQTTITGDGSESYSLPADFVRLAYDQLGVYETTTLRRAGTPVSSDGLWTHVNQIGGAGAFRYYKIEGYDGAYTIKFEDDLVTGDSVTVSYISNIIAITGGSTESATIQTNTDVMILPRRLLETGTTYRFRERRGLDFEAEKAAYEGELARLSINVGNVRIVPFGPPSDEFKPMRVPTPDYIPSS